MLVKVVKSLFLKKISLKIWKYPDFLLTLHCQTKTIRDMEEKFKIEVALTKERLATWFQELFDGADDILADVKDSDMSVWFKTKEEWETEMPIWERYAIFFMRSREMRVRFTEESEQGNVSGILPCIALKPNSLSWQTKILMSLQGSSLTILITLIEVVS